VVWREARLTVCEKHFAAVLTPDLEDGGFSESCKEIQAAISQGETIQKALHDLVDVVELCLKTKKESTKSRVGTR
jgi:predicted RNase H-like HicB family nuclease